MDKKQIKQALTQIASEGVKDDVNLWHRIQHQVNTGNPTIRQTSKAASKIVRFPNIQMASRLIAGSIVFLFMGMVVYAFYQLGDFVSLDDGLQAVERTELNLTQSNENMTVTLNWVYADAHRIAIGYSTSVDMQYYEAVPSLVYSELRDSNGNSYPSAFGGGGGGNASENIAEGESIINFDVSMMDNVPSELILDYELIFQEIARPDMQGTGGGGGGSSSGTSSTTIPPQSSSGGGGGGGGNGTPPNMTVSPNGTPISFNFSFTVPFIPAQIIETGQSVTVNDITMTLESVVVTPSMTVAKLCYTNPANTDPLFPYVIIEGESFTAQQVGGYGIIEGDDRACVSVQYLESFYEQTGEWTITVPYLRGIPDYSPENETLYLSILEENGVGVIRDSVDSLPPNTPFINGLVFENVEDADFEIVFERANRAISTVYEGNWEFTVTYP